MKINKINIKNFRCFTDIKLDFASKMNVITGVNGSGKSNLLVAIWAGLCTMLDDHYCHYGDFRVKHVVVNKIYKYLDKLLNFDRSVNLTSSIQCEIKKNDRIARFKIVQRSKEDKYEDLSVTSKHVKILESSNDAEKKTTSWPLLVFFEDSFHADYANEYDTDVDIFEPKLPIGLAYYELFWGINKQSIWNPRLIYINDRIDESLKNLKHLTRRDEKINHSSVDVIQDNKTKKESYLELINTLSENNIKLTEPKTTLGYIDEADYVENKIKKFTSLEAGMGDLDFVIKSVQAEIGFNERHLQFNFANGKSVIDDNLPMGYKKLLYMVIDIACRSFILMQDGIEPKGVVVIDTIDLHLHPTLQQGVLQRFQQTFPNLQFIVTTHSPLIVGDIKTDKNEVKLFELINDPKDGKKVVELSNIYGASYTTILREVMGANQRPSDVEYLVNAIVALKSAGRFEDANKVQKELQKLVGDNEHIIHEIDNRVEKNIKK